jgi:hypothetical protein
VSRNTYRNALALNHAGLTIAMELQWCRYVNDGLYGVNSYDGVLTIGAEQERLR